MSDDDTQMPADGTEEIEETQIRFGDHWIPAHKALEKMETIASVTDRIDQFNKNFPNLSSKLTRSVVATARVRLDNYELRNPSEKVPVDLALVAIDLLSHMDPESVVEELDREHNQTFNLRELIGLVGEEHYLSALRREAIEFQENRILPAQTAEIWGEMSRPAPGGGLWNQKKVETLILSTPSDDT